MDVVAREVIPRFALSKHTPLRAHRWLGMLSPTLKHRAERAKPFGLVFYEATLSTTSAPAPQGLCRLFAEQTSARSLQLRGGLPAKG